MKSAARQTAVLAVILIFVCAACRLLLKNQYTASYPLPVPERDKRAEDFDVVADRQNVVSVGKMEVENGYLFLQMNPDGRGNVFLTVQEGGDDVGLLYLRVNRFGTVFDYSTGGFTGDWIVLICYTLFWIAVAAISFRSFSQAKGPGFYAYSTVYSAGMSMFAFLTGLTMLFITLRHLIDPQMYSMMSVYDGISGASFTFVMLTSPLVTLFALAMMVSNVALLRHESFRISNILAIGVGALLILGEVGAYLCFTRSFSGSELEGRIDSMLRNSYGTVLAYFECMLAGTMICGVKAAHHVPSFDRDYLIVLGCRFRRDGTLPPLLRGRVDKALQFWRDQKKNTGRAAIFVPSGGQGRDETMPEAEAISRYLMENGVGEDLIREESASRNTLENMKFSKTLIDAEKQDAKVAYVTTNYHVFRSGVWAARTGLRAEGLGSKTAWWYWPNAFMREWAGLMRSRIKQEIILLVILLAFFGALSMAL